MRVHRSTTEQQAGSGLSLGDVVLHRREPSLGRGIVLSIGRGSKPMLVGWDTSLETYHAPGELERLARSVPDLEGSAA